MGMLDLIERKKRGDALSEHEIRSWIAGVSDGSAPDYQSSALLMAMTLRGLDAREIDALTDAMANSGERLDLSAYGDCSADKHSSGGVGDSTSFLVVPIVAACGMVVGKMSRRGLGHTGGTLDKIQAIRGVRTQLSKSEFYRQLDTVGAALAGQTGEICPADKKLYALRDVTGTVDCTGLIAASIMSKKLAAGARNIVLDVKCGRAAFMQRREDAAELARMMVGIGKRAGRNVRAVVTDMRAPLSRYVGNALEVYGAIRILRGEERGPLYDVAIELASNLLGMHGVSDARARAERAVESGAALERFDRLIRAQGATEDVCAQPQLLNKARCRQDVYAAEDGYVTDIDAMQIARYVCDIGGGRRKMDDAIDPYVGAELHVRVAQPIAKGERIATIYANDPSRIRADLMQHAVRIGRERTDPIRWIREIIES